MAIDNFFQSRKSTYLICIDFGSFLIKYQLSRYIHYNTYYNITVKNMYRRIYEVNYSLKRDLRGLVCSN